MVIIKYKEKILNKIKENKQCIYEMKFFVKNYKLDVSGEIFLKYLKGK